MDYPSETGYPFDNSRQYVLIWKRKGLNFEWTIHPTLSIILFFRQFWRIVKIDYPSQMDNPSLVWLKRLLKAAFNFQSLMVVISTDVGKCYCHFQPSSEGFVHKIWNLEGLLQSCVITKTTLEIKWMVTFWHFILNLKNNQIKYFLSRLAIFNQNFAILEYRIWP